MAIAPSASSSTDSNPRADADSGIDMIHKTCGHSLSPRIACGCCGEIVKPRDMVLTRAENRRTEALAADQLRAWEIRTWSIAGIVIALLAAGIAWVEKL